MLLNVANAQQTHAFSSSSSSSSLPLPSPYASSDASIALLLLQEQALRLEFAASLARQFGLTEAEAADAAAAALERTEDNNDEEAAAASADETGDSTESFTSDEEREYQAFVRQLLPPSGAQAATAAPATGETEPAEVNFPHAIVTPLARAASLLPQHRTEERATAAAPAAAPPAAAAAAVPSFTSSPLAHPRGNVVSTATVAAMGMSVPTDDVEADQQLSPWGSSEEDELTALMRRQGQAATPHTSDPHAHRPVLIGTQQQQQHPPPSSPSVRRPSSSPCRSSPTLASALASVADWRSAISPALQAQRQARAEMLRDAAQQTEQAAAARSPHRGAPHPQTSFRK